MDNASRSERSRNAALQAALKIIARDGPSRLTLEAIAREAGMSKGAVTHHFHLKESVIKALLDQQADYLDEFAHRYVAKHGAKTSQPALAAQIATNKEAIRASYPVAFAVLGALVMDPSLLSVALERDVKGVEALKAEAADPQLALLRWVAARGLAWLSLLGLCPFSNKERDALFDRLLDDAQWEPLTKSAPTPSRRRVNSK